MPCAFAQSLPIAWLHSSVRSLLSSRVRENDALSCCCLDVWRKDRANPQSFAIKEIQTLGKQEKGPLGVPPSYPATCKKEAFDCSQTGSI